MWFHVQEGVENLLPSNLKHLTSTWARFVHLINHNTRHDVCYSNDDQPSFVILNLSRMRKEFGKKKITEMLKWAKDNKHVICDNWYLTAKDHGRMDAKSFGYRLSPEILKLPIVRKPFEDKYLKRRLKQQDDNKFRHYSKTVKHLFSWYEKLEIDDQVFEELFNNKITAVSPFASKCMLTACEAIRDKQCTKEYFSLTQFGRINSRVANLSRQCRPFLKINGRFLSSIDISNSQPTFVAVSFINKLRNKIESQGKKQEERQGRRPLETGTLPYDGHLLQNSLVTTCNNNDLQDSPTAATSVFVPSETNTDFVQYVKDVEAGKLYKILMDGIGWERTKDQFKDQIWFKFFYGEIIPRHYFKEEVKEREYLTIMINKLIKFFEERYPTVYHLMKEEKSVEFENFSRNMQRAESDLVITGVCGRLMNEYPEIPVLTIHDSIMTHKEHIPLVQKLIQEEFTKLGVKPSFGIDHYGPQEEKKEVTITEQTVKQQHKPMGSITEHKQVKPISNVDLLPKIDYKSVSAVISNFLNTRSFDDWWGSDSKTLYNT